VEKKAQIVRRHLADKVPVSDLADAFSVQPSQIHMWVKQVLDQAEKAFEQPTPEGVKGDILFFYAGMFC